MDTQNGRISVTAEEACDLLGVSPLHFLRMFDRGKARPELNRDGKYVFGLRELRQVEIRRERPEYFPESKFASVDQAVTILDITRKTFYNRVNAGKIPIHRCGKRTFVKLVDLYATDELF